MKPGFICRDRSTHRIHVCRLLQILVPFTDKKVGVWCALSRIRIIGPYASTGPSILSLLRHSPRICESADGPKLTFGYLQQDGPACYTCNRPLGKIKSFFGGWIICEIHSAGPIPRLSPPVFSLWGLLMGAMFKQKQGTVNDLT
jgi:hypothetical protein